MTKIASIIIASILLAACAGGGATREPVSPAERAQQRWDLVVAGDLAKAYDYLTPGFRSMTTREQYVASQSQRPVRRKSAKVMGAECPTGELHCDVAVLVEVQLPPGLLPGKAVVPSTSPITERWILLNGVWYYAPKEISRGG